MSIILFSILAFFTPLIFGSPTHEAYELPKMFFVYLVGGLIIWLFLVKVKRMVLPSREVLAFVLFYGISTALSIHKYTSVWGYYKRFNGGLVSVLIFAGLMVVLINKFKRGQIHELINYISLAAVPISVYAMFQHYGPSHVVRAFSTFGQPNWLAAYLVMAGLVALGNLVKAEKRNESIFWSAVFVLSFWGSWLTYSMSGILGFIVGVAYFLFLNRGAVREKSKHFLVLLALILTISISSPGIFAAKLKDIFIDIQKVYAQNEQVENAVSDPGFIRTELWVGTLKLFVSSPKNILVGTGPETFAYAFQEFRPTSLNYSSEWEFVFNKPHNYYLELAAQIGLLGVTAYFLIIKKSLKSPYAPVLAAFYVTNLFGWPTVTTALFFWLILAELEAKE